jgi:hypothetical protein
VSDTADPIHLCIGRWHRHIAKELDGGLEAMLHPDVVFFSPVVFTPQVGRDITMLYLGAAEATLGAPETGFRYTKQVLDGHQAVLEFETTMDGKSVNGVDIITCDDDSMIVEFKVMVRPLQGLNAVHAQMMAMLEALAPDQPAS